MNFISIEYYLVLLAIVIMLLFIKKKENKYIFVLLINYGFAYLFGLETLIALFIITIITYLASKTVINHKKTLPIWIICLVAILVTFKILNVSSNIVVPIGLSFYTLQSIGYLIDISKDSSKYETNFILFATALSFFPALSSGPIEKLINLIPRLKDDLGYNSTKAQKGVQLIAEGLFKRLVIANRVVDYVDKVYSSPSSYNGLTILIAIVLYSIQIYCDFSAYSDIAVGSANLIGIDLVNNFNYPYFSKSIKEFWRKWHISLSTWLKEYVYIPLGGNKVSKFRRFINVLITFIVSGLWHGLSFTYLVWGLIHGLLNAIPSNKSENKYVNTFKTLFTFVLVSLSWVFFRAGTITDSLNIFKGLFTNFSIDYNSVSSAVLLFTGDIMAIPYSITTLIMILILFIKEWLCIYKQNVYRENTYLCIIVICIILFGTNGNGAFIYQGF